MTPTDYLRCGSRSLETGFGTTLVAMTGRVGLSLVNSDYQVHELEGLEVNITSKRSISI